MKIPRIILSFLLAAVMIHPAAGQAASKAAVLKAEGIRISASEMIGKDREFTGGHAREVKSVAFSLSGKLIASGGADGSVVIWDAATGNKTTLEGHSLAVDSVAFSRDGKVLASASRDNTIALWEISTGKEVKDFMLYPRGGLASSVGRLKSIAGGASYLRTLSFSPDGKFLASGSGDRRVIIWDIKSGEKVHVLDGHSRQVRSVAYSPDGKMLASGSDDRSIVLWDPGAEKELATLDGHKGPVTSVTFSPDGKILASGSDDATVAVWDVKSGKKIATLKGHADSVNSVAFSPDGWVLASGSDDKSVILWNLATGTEIKKLEDHRDSVYGVAFSPDGMTLASGSADKSIIVWNLQGVSLGGAISKGEFETTKEYEERLRKNAFPYQCAVAIDKYDADRGGFESHIFGTTILVKVPRERAREIIGRKDQLKLDGTLRYIDAGTLELMNAAVIDPASHDRFVVVKIAEPEAVVAVKTPIIPVPPSLPKPVEQAAPAVDVNDIPDFKVKARKDDIAVVIGIENYRGLPKSDFSKGDARIMKDYLKALGFQERNISFLVDEGASLSDIRKTLELWLPNRVKKDSTVFIYYSGHGAPDPSTGEAYIVPYDGDPNYLAVTGYSLKSMYERLGKMPAGKVVVLLDSCFSGAGGRSLLAKGARPLVMMAEPSTLSENLAVLSATQGSQISTSSPEKGHGVFTYYFLKALKEGKTDLADIYEYLKPQVEDEAKSMNVQQSPSLSPETEKVKGKFMVRK